MLMLDRKSGKIYHGTTCWNGWRHGWQPAGAVPPDLEQVTARVALAASQEQAPRTGLPIGVIGPKFASADQCHTAEAVGAMIADMNVPLFCGGKSGVMEAACKGAKSRNGLTIGLLPDDEWNMANEFVDVPLASGIGPSRNAIIARACPVLIAVGGEYGTLTEMAFGLHFNRTVIGLDGAPAVKGALTAETAEQAVELAASAYLGANPN